MGLTIYARTEFSVIENDEVDEWEKVVNWTDFPRSIDGVHLSDEVASKQWLQFEYNSRNCFEALTLGYGGYNSLRALISQTMTGHSPEWYWERIDGEGRWNNGETPDGMPEDPYDVPFMDIIHFSDYEGIIAGNAFIRLYNSFVDAKTNINETRRTAYQNFMRVAEARETGFKFSRKYDDFELSMCQVANEPNPFLTFG